MIRVRRALLSASNKDGLVQFARGLAELGIELISTGGTARLLREAGLVVTDVAEVTGFPEMLDGRVKTLHPRIHGGLLGIRGNAEHARQMAAQGITPIDLLAITLYPFEATVESPDATVAEAIEQIDIGGPAMIRSAAKNFAGVAVIVNPADYGAVLDELRRNAGSLSQPTRLALAAKAFAHTARYDARITGLFDRLTSGLGQGGFRLSPLGSHVSFPPLLDLRLEKLRDLRYGENPHQRAALYRDLSAPGGLAAARKLQGKELSYNNLLDLHAAWELVREFEEPVAAIIKHSNPCGVASALTLCEAYARARETDPVSAFGGIIAVNRPLDAPTARAIAGTFVEAVIAPGYAEEALVLLQGKKNLRLLELPLAHGSRPPASGGYPADGYEVRRITGGMLVQERDTADLDPNALTVATKRSPSETEMRGLRFAWRVAKHVKSNAIVLTEAQATVGIGAGQMSRVDAVRLAIQKAKLPTRGTVLASDAFFPFRDGVDEAAKAGVSAIIQPGGSVRDAEVIAAADEYDLAMVFTGIRHFRH